MGGPQKLQRRREQGVLNARERLAALFDGGSFDEVGEFAASLRPEDRDRTPADGKITGFGRIDGRAAAAVANDFTVLGASSSPVNTRKIRYLKETAQRRGLPIVFLGESAGGRMPDSMGAASVAANQDPTQYQRRRTSPWVSAVLGPCYGSSTWYSCLSDFVVMRRGARMAVGSPRLAALATGEAVDDEELAGWRLHAYTSGLVDAAVDSDEEALRLVRRFLSYLPSHVGQPAPRAAAAQPPRADALAQLVPERLNQGYDMRRVLGCIVDADSLFELKANFGRSIVTALARIDGRAVGVIASNPMFKGGAIDADACSKATSMIVLCDSFNVPIISLADQPGFLIGLEGERKAMPGRVMNWMNALSLCTVPKITIVARKTYGQAVLNMGLGANSDLTCAWTTAEISFMDPGYGANIVHGVSESDDPEAYAKARAEMARDTSALEAAGAFYIHNVIDPRDTRAFLSSALETHSLAATGGVGEGHLRAWPTTVF